MLAEDQNLVRQGICSLLELSNSIEVVGQVEDGSEVVEGIGRYKPDVLLLDIRMPKMDGITLSKNIRKTLRFSDDEFAMIQQKLDLANITFSDFARSAILKKKIKLPIEKELIYQISKIGNNLNQIARAVNGKDKVAILTELVEIEKQLKALRNGS